jgi:hypothetical protein
MNLSFQDIYNICSPVIGGGLTATISHLLKVRRMNMLKKLKDPVMESVKNNVLVENKLNQILADYEADRVWLIQFHNGGNFYPTGKSIPKFSMFYETLKPGAESFKDFFQNIPVSIFGRCINYLYDNDILMIQDYLNVSEELHEIRCLADDSDAKSSYSFAIKTIDNKFVGIMGMDFVKKKRDIDPIKIKEIQIDVMTMSGSLLNQSHD